MYVHKYMYNSISTKYVVSTVNILYGSVDDRGNNEYI